MNQFLTRLNAAVTSRLESTPNDETALMKEIKRERSH